MYEVGELVKIYLFQEDKFIIKKDKSNCEYGIVLEIKSLHNAKVYKVVVNNKIFHTIESYMEKYKMSIEINLKEIISKRSPKVCDLVNILHQVAVPKHVYNDCLVVEITESKKN